MDNRTLAPTVSVIVPCRNEEKFIGALLDNILKQDYPADSIEVFIADGQSTDNTPSIIKSYCEQHPFIHCIENPHRTVPHALNMAIQKSTGDIIVRMDVHADYPVNYISRLVEAVAIYKCENAGGVCDTLPANDTLEAKAIARALSHPFGIGNSYFRIGVSKPREVDTVPFGCFSRELFERIGMFDEDLVRNQDDEFNARIIQNGGRIILLPDLVIRYFARDKLSKLSVMYYQYGYFKPLVNLKLGKPATWRQFVPPVFVLFIAISALSGLFNPMFARMFFLVLSAYLIINLGTSLLINLKHHKEGAFFGWLFSAFMVIHFSYGWGYLRGFATFVLPGRKIKNEQLTPNR